MTPGDAARPPQCPAEGQRPTASSLSAPSSARPSSSPRAVVVFDVEGVIAPVGGHTAWGDDINVAIDPWPVMASPAMCSALDALAGDQVAGIEGSAGSGVLCCWLTRWPQQLRNFMSTFPGRNWPNVADRPELPPPSPRSETPLSHQDPVAIAHEWAGSHWSVVPWWKWWILDHWLQDHPSVRTLIWIDSELAEHRFPDGRGPSHKAWTIQTALRRGAGIEATLIAPDKHVGVTPDHLVSIHEVLSRSSGSPVEARNSRLPMTRRLEEALADLRALSAGVGDVPIGEMTAVFYIHAYNQYDVAVRELLSAIGADLDDAEHRA